MDDAVLSGLEHAGVDGGGGQRRIIGVDAGAPDGALGVSGHIEVKALSDAIAIIDQSAGIGLGADRLRDGGASPVAASITMQRLKSADAIADSNRFIQLAGLGVALL